MKKSTKVLFGIALVLIFIDALAWSIAFVKERRSDDRRPEFTAIFPKTIEDMKIPPQECRRFLDTNPNACDKG